MGITLRSIGGYIHTYSCIGKIRSRAINVVMVGLLHIKLQVGIVARLGKRLPGISRVHKGLCS